MPRANGEIGRRTTLKMWRGSPSCRFESDSAHQITVISGYYGVDASIRLNINLTLRSRFYAYWKHPYYLPHWTDEIDNFRLELSLLFRSQVIYNHALERFGYCYQKALGKARRKSGLTLPVDCPWTIEKIVDEDWFPG